MSEKIIIQFQVMNGGDKPIALSVKEGDLVISTRISIEQAEGIRWNIETAIALAKFGRGVEINPTSNSGQEK